MIKYLSLLIVLFFLQSCLGKSDNSKNEVTEPTKSISLKEKDFDFGTLFLTDSIQHKYEVKNISNKPLVIESVNNDCYCKIEWPTGKILPGKIAKIVLHFKPLKEGKIKNSIVIGINSPDKFHVLSIHGNVKKTELHTKSNLESI